MTQEDLNFLQVVSVVSSRFNAVIDEIDLENRQVSITCPGGKMQELGCAVMMGEILNQNNPGENFYLC